MFRFLGTLTLVALAVWWLQDTVPGWLLDGLAVILLAAYLRWCWRKGNEPEPEPEPVVSVADQLEAERNAALKAAALAGYYAGRSEQTK